jgi:transcription elongation factor GreA
VIDEAAAARSGVVTVGSTVELEREDGELMTLEISSVGGVSPESPVGRAVLGKAEGEQIHVEAPRGAWSARVVSIRR